MKREKNRLKMCFKKRNENSRTPYENLIDSLKHAYDKIPYMELERKKYAHRILDH